MPSVVYAEPTPAWVATNDPTLPWRVQTSQYTAEMADYLDAGAHPGGMLWRFTHRSGRVTTYAPEAIAFVDHLLHFDPLIALAHVQATVAGDTITFDHPAYRVTYQALHDRLKLTILLKMPFRAPDPALTTPETAFLTLTGGIQLPADLEVWDRTGKRTGDFSTRGEVYLKDASGNVVQFLDRVTARDSEGHPGGGELRLVTDADGTRRLYQGMAWGWLQAASFEPTEEFPEGGVEIDPTIATSTNATPTGLPNQRKSARFANGILLDTFYDGTNTVCRYSTDNGTTWNTPATGATVVASGTRPSLFIDEDDFIHVVTLSGTTLTYVRGTPDANRTSYTWSAQQNTTATNTPQTPDVVAHKEGTGYKAHLFWTEASASPNNTTFYRRMNISNVPALSWDIAATIIGAGGYGVNDFTYPSAALDSSKNVYVSWQTGSAVAGNGVRFAKGAYSAGAWTWPTSSGVEVITEAVFANQMGPCLVDSQGRTVVAFRDSSASLYIRVFRRSAAGAWVDISPATLAGQNPTFALDVSDNIYLWYTNSGLFRRKYDGATWAAAVTVDATTSAAFPSARRNSAGAALDVVYTTGTASPYNVVHHRLTLNLPPTKPTNITIANFDATATQRLAYLHNDPDGNAQAAQQLQFVRVDTGAIVLDTGKTATANQYYDIAANAMPQSKQIQVRVMTWDTADAASPWSDYATFYTSAKPAAAITYPAADGATHNGGSLTARGTVSDPESEGSSGFQWTLTTSADVLLWDGLKQATTSPPLQTVGYTAWTNGASYKLKLTAWDAKGIQSVQAVRTFTVSYTPPAVPTSTVTPNAGLFPPCVTVTVTNPAPVAPQPNVSSNRIERRIAGSTDAWLKLGTCAVNGSFKDYGGISGVYYDYRPVAIGDNQTEAAGASQVAGVTFTGIYLHDVADPAGANVFLRYDTSRSEDWRAEATMMQFAGRSRAVANFGEQEEGKFRADVILTTSAQWTALRDLVRRKSTLCWRDGSGRKAYGAITSLPVQDEPGGGKRVTFELFETDYTEGV